MKLRTKIWIGVNGAIAVIALLIALFGGIEWGTFGYIMLGTIFIDAVIGLIIILSKPQKNTARKRTEDEVIKAFNKSICAMENRLDFQKGMNARVHYHAKGKIWKGFVYSPTSWEEYVALWGDSQENPVIFKKESKEDYLSVLNDISASPDFDKFETEIYPDQFGRAIKKVIRPIEKRIEKKVDAIINDTEEEASE